MASVDLDEKLIAPFQSEVLYKFKYNNFLRYFFAAVLMCLPLGGLINYSIFGGDDRYLDFFFTLFIGSPFLLIGTLLLMSVKNDLKIHSDGISIPRPWYERKLLKRRAYYPLNGITAVYPADRWQHDHHRQSPGYRHSSPHPPGGEIIP